MKFSIIINTHNQEKFIYKSINSCLRQKFSDYEILIFDTSCKKLNYKFRKFMRRKKIKYFHSKIKFAQPEKNQMYKIYRGLKKSKGEFLCLLDGDDYFSLQKLKKGVKISKKLYETEASGGITLKNVREFAATGVKRLSVGKITHSVPAIDFKLEI